SFSPSSEADCARLEELNATTLELLATVKAKAAYSLSKLDQMAASAGVFGKLSANVAAVIEHVFSKSGRPRAYVIGE
ncbi:hypothetical protein ABTL65_19820, partial [Acinetobacter baumannii]